MNSVSTHALHVQNVFEYKFPKISEADILSQTYMATSKTMNLKNDHRRKFSNLSNWKEQAWKKSGLQRD